MASCGNDERQVMRYHDGELTPAQMHALEEHVDTCPACAAELAWLRGLSRFVRAARPQEVPAGLVDRLHMGLGTMRERAVVRTAEVLALAAALVLAVCVGWAVHVRTVRESAPMSLAPWEVVAVTPRTEPAPMTDDQAYARWVVYDLSAENGHD